MNRAFGCSATPEQHAAAPLAGGIVRNGYQCGMVWGASLAAGREACRRFGLGREAEAAAVLASRRVVEAFRDRYGVVDCFGLTEANLASERQVWKFLLTGKPIGCFHMAAQYAPRAVAAVGDALERAPETVPVSPVSCSAIVARRLGASDLHAVTAAGLAGGIGLSGGGCGALGAAIWLDGMSGGGTFEAMEARARQLVDRFLAASAYRFECAEIAGRRFVDVADHAAYLRGGGCAAILDALAPQRDAPAFPAPIPMEAVE